VQVIQETALQELEARFPLASAATISMSDQELVELAVRHLHPKFICMFRDSGRASRHPEVVLTEVPGEGFAERVIGSHAFCVDPGFFDLSDALSPLNHFEAIAFENATGVGFEPMLKEADLYARREPMTGDRLSNMGSWMNYFFTPPDLIESRRTYRFAFHPNAGDAGFRRAAHGLGFFACQARLTGAIYRVIRELRHGGCTLAAELAATAHYAGRLRRRWRTKGAVTAFVPDNAAIQRWGLEPFNALVMPGNERRLIEAVFAHLCEGTLEFASGDTVAAPAGSGFARTARIVAGPLRRDDCTIYVIDRVLYSPAAARATGPSLLPNRWELHPTRLFSTAGAPPPPADQAAPVDRGSGSQAVRPSARPFVRSVARTAYFAVRRIPGATRPADWLKSTMLAALHRARMRRDMTIGEGIAAVSGTAPTAAAKAEAIVHSSERRAPTHELIELFRDVQRARAVLTLAEVLNFYRTKMATVTADLPGLALAEQCVREAQLDEDTLITTLRSMLDQADDFAEAWYELGDLLLVDGHCAEAIECFDRCLTSREAFRTHARTSCYVLAAAAKAAALEASGFLEAAAETYRRAMDTGGQSGLAYIAYGRLLRRLGRPREAATAFDAGLESDGTVCDLAAMPRDFTEVSTRLIERFVRENAETAAP
jgi:hypothetical protein